MHRNNRQLYSIASSARASKVGRAVGPRALGSQIDGQLEFRWLLHSKSAGLGTLQYFTHVGRRQAKAFDDVGALAHEGATFKMSFVCENVGGLRRRAATPISERQRKAIVSVFRR